MAGDLAAELVLFPGDRQIIRGSAGLVVAG